ncbi:MAG: CRTAC1 family protein [Armatimonadetes bacterium]|nr:CRTAC1 family protein [Armatimonadota bacterium]
MNILETSSAGAGFLDYDQDGWLDLVLVGLDGAALYHNDQGRRFTEVTAATGLRLPPGRYHGCASADLDNDGYPELLITGYHRQVLFRNDAGRRWVDVTAASGVGSRQWGTSASFFDGDRDGKLDLLVGHYVRFGPGLPEFMNRNGVPITLGPDAYEGDKLRYFRNLGRLQFREQTREAGFHSTRGKNFALGACDFDNDGDDDVYIANDEMPGNLYVNDGRGRFTDRGTESGTALSGTGRRQGGMGVAWGDYNRDGRFDLLVATYTQEPKSLYRNDGAGFFSEQSYETQLTQRILPLVAFGVVWLDANLDGYLDVALVSGHVQDQIQRLDPTSSYPQPMKLFLGQDGLFQDVTESSGNGFARSIVGRALAVGDLDNDGDPDLLAADLEGAPVLLRNESTSVGRWLGLQCWGGRGSNRMAIGARITVRAGEVVQIREVRTDGSYLATQDPRVQVGLGHLDRVDSVEIRWPSGRVERLGSLDLGRYHRVEEGGG